jgi:hypothetical protein
MILNITLDYILKLFIEAFPNPVFLLHATLMIPAVTVKPNLEDVQEALTSVGKIITGVAKGVAQWNSRGGKVRKIILKFLLSILKFLGFYILLFTVRTCGKLIHLKEI